MQQGGGSQLALWGYVHESGEHTSFGGCLRDDMVINRQGVDAVFACVSSGGRELEGVYGAVDASEVVQGNWQQHQQQKATIPSATHFAAWCP